MKNIILKILTLSIVGAFMSCQDEDKFNSPVTHELSKGGFVRFAEGDQPNFNLNVIPGQAPSEVFTSKIEDPNGNITKVDYEMISIVSGDTTSVSPFRSITSFPSDFDISPSDIATSLGLTPADLDGGNTFEFNATITTSEGQVFTYERPVFQPDSLVKILGGNLSDNLLDEGGYRQAMEFKVSYACVITDPIPGIWVLKTIDLYGDGWNGAIFTFDIDGVKTEYAAADSGSDFNITVPEGTAFIAASYSSPSPGRALGPGFEEENEYTLTDPEGNVILDEGKGVDIFPFAGSVFCPH
ncbi:hypothetical protein ABW636_15100 [Aquimarina sp. 2201CG1-2-11]|uniref:hypothetical protein n=1 Tax=Aquimarina discodermiae TaxID=3231043 RepID=UPI003461ED62